MNCCITRKLPTVRGHEWGFVNNHKLEKEPASTGALLAGN